MNSTECTFIIKWLTKFYPEFIASRHNDDPVDCEGRAHLVEHVINMHVCRVIPRSFLCETLHLTTLFSFMSDFDNIVREIEFFCTQLFSKVLVIPEKVAKEIVEQQVDVVDNEFHENRMLTSIENNVTRNILKHENMFPFKFRMGNKKSLTNDGRRNAQHLLEEVEQHRQHYRERPFSVCIYSNEISKVKFKKKL